MQAQALCEWFTSRKAWCTACRRAPFCLRGSYICNVRSPMSHAKADFEKNWIYIPRGTIPWARCTNTKKNGKPELGNSIGYEPRQPETYFGRKDTPPYRTVRACFGGRAVLHESGCFVSGAGLLFKPGVFARQTTATVASRDALRQSHGKFGMNTFWHTDPKHHDRNKRIVDRGLLEHGKPGS